MRALRTSVAALLAALPGVAQEPAPLHYRIDAAGSELSWELPATLHTVHGKAPRFEGAVDAEPGARGQWHIEARVVVAAASMVTGNGKRDRTMREKVLETGRFPEIVFEARRVVADLSRLLRGERFTAEVTGDLEVHGRAASVRLPVDVEVFPDHVVLEGSFPLSWREYGLADPSFAFVRVRDPMKVVFRLRAVPVSKGP